MGLSHIRAHGLFRQPLSTSDGYAFILVKNERIVFAFAAVQPYLRALPSRLNDDIRRARGWAGWVPGPTWNEAAGRLP
jgi:hypothetical protein